VAGVARQNKNIRMKKTSGFMKNCNMGSTPSWNWGFDRNSPFTF
jgi:hypothetical protein